MARHILYHYRKGTMYRGVSWAMLGLGIIAAVISIAVFVQRSVTTEALSGSDFKAGNIITDSVFFDGGRLNASGVQNFLNARVPACDTWGTKIRSGNQTRAQYGASRGYPAPYTCLRDYAQNTPTMTGESGLCSTYTGRANQSAAQIIADVGAICGVNQQSLIILLEKEQSLVTDDWPWSVQYASATGFGCPDTAPCDSSYGGFFYQVYYAARQFKKYARDNAQYGYRAYRNNYIQYNPNTACGGSNIYIENQSTAGLYVYTPYQPNGPALSNLYGTGDGCSAYGNRNFWRLFNDWFGSTNSGSFLLRTVDNGTVYLVSDTMKYPIADMNVLNALPLGPVGYVSSSYLNSKQTGQTLGRIIRDSQGTVYYFDARIKLSFSSCDLVVDYGYSCGDSALLTDVQIGSFATGPRMTNYYRTTSGKNFYINDGNKREVFDQQSLTGAGLGGAFNVLTETPLGNLTYGPPIIRPGVAVAERGTSSRFILTGTAKRPVSAGLLQQTTLNRLASGSLDKSSLAQISTGTAIGAIFTDATSGTKYVLGQNGRYSIDSPTAWVGDETVPALESTVASQLPLLGNTDERLVKSLNSGTIYMIDNGTKRSISSWDDLLQIDSSTRILTLPDATVSSVASGVPIMTQGALVKSPTSGTVYYVDGMGALVPLTTFAISNELGVRGVKVYPDSTVNGYEKRTGSLRSAVRCNGITYWGLGGALYNIANSELEPASVTPLDLDVCPPGVATHNLGSTLFLLGGDGTIYQVVDGRKLPIGSYPKYLSLGGSEGNTIRAGNVALALLPSGDVL